MMNSNGGNPTRLTNNAALDRAPTFSPDGTTIAFQTPSASSSLNLGVVEVAKLPESQGSLARSTTANPNSSLEVALGL
jgi:Tol biopolymer transport system component